MSVTKFVKGVIVLPELLPYKKEIRVSDITYLEVSPLCEKGDNGRYLVDDEHEKESILEHPQKLSEGSEGLIFSLRGLYDGFRKGEKIHVMYQTDTGIHWVEGYQLLGDDNEPISNFNWKN